MFARCQTTVVCGWGWTACCLWLVSRGCTVSKGSKRSENKQTSEHGKNTAVGLFRLEMVHSQLKLDTTNKKKRVTRKFKTANHTKQPSRKPVRTKRPRKPIKRHFSPDKYRGTKATCKLKKQTKRLACSIGSAPFRMDSPPPPPASGCPLSRAEPPGNVPPSRGTISLKRAATFGRVFGGGGMGRGKLTEQQKRGQGQTRRYTFGVKRGRHERVMYT